MGKEEEDEEGTGEIPESFKLGMILIYTLIGILVLALAKKIFDWVIAGRRRRRPSGVEFVPIVQEPWEAA